MLAPELLRPAGTLVAYFLVCLSLLFFGHRILLHPLRGYPGPFLAKLTAWYAGYYAIDKSLHLKLLENHQKYGSVFRLAPNRLVFNTTTAFRAIYQSDQLIKSHTYQSTAKDFKVNLFTERNRDAHRAKRKIIGQVLTERSMRLFEPILRQQTDICLKQILEAAKSSTPVNITEKARYLALDIIGQLSFGYDLGVQTSDKNRFILGAMSFGHYRLNIYHHLYFLSRIEPTKLLNYLARDS